MRDSKEPWIHVLVGVADWGSLPNSLQRRYCPTGITAVLDGRMVKSLAEFYSEVERTVPLISGFGRNLNALLDLFRTFGWGRYAGENHVFAWYQPEHMLKCADEDFREVADVLVGASKELLVGEERDANAGGSDSEEWIPTRVELVFVTNEVDFARRIACILSRLSDDWADEFYSLDVPVTVETLA